MKTQKFNRAQAKKRVLQRRKSMGMTQEEVASEVGMSTQSYSTAERDGSQVFFTLEQLPNLAKILNVTIDHIILGEASSIPSSEEMQMILNHAEEKDKIIKEKDDKINSLQQQLDITMDLVESLKGQIELLKAKK